MRPPAEESGCGAAAHSRTQVDRMKPAQKKPSGFSEYETRRFFVCW